MCLSCGKWRMLQGTKRAGTEFKNISLLVFKWMTVLWSCFSLDLLPKLLHWHVLFWIFLHHLRWTENINVMSSLKINKNFFIELIINYTSKITMKAPNPNHAGDLLYNHNVLLIYYFFSSIYFCLSYYSDVVTQLCLWETWS